MGVACGPGYPLQVLALPAHSPTRAVGFTLLSNAAPALLLTYVYMSLRFSPGPLVATRNDVVERAIIT
jgi:hypothetical protein